MKSGRNNTVAGLLVLSTLIATVAIVMALSSSWDSFGRQQYTVHYDLTEGVTGLTSGSAVLLGGKEIGVVDSVRFDPSPEDPTGLLVTISCDRRLQLREGAVALLNMPLLGGGSSINFPMVGSGAPLTETDVIDGTIATAGFLSQAGYGPEQSEQLKRIMARADEISRKMDETIDEFEQLAIDSRAMVADARDRSDGWFDRIDSITQSVDEAAQQAPEITSNIDARVDQFGETLASFQSAVEENRTDIDATIDNARSMSARGDEFLQTLNQDLVSQFEAILADADSVLQGAQQSVATVNETMDEQLPSVRRSVANARLASDQLAATLAEVRRSPWRLLYRPDTRELEFELLYDSARAYAAAVSDLRAASESLESASASSQDPERLEVLAGELERTITSYQEAEQQFLDLVARHASGAD